MKIRPFATLPLRARLNAEGWCNARVHKIAPYLESYWGNGQPGRTDAARARSYLRVEINPYALIGHQVSSWVHGYLWARDLDLHYLGGSLSRDKSLLFDFSKMTKPAPPRGYKSVRLIWVDDERDPRSLRLLRAQIAHAQRKYPDRDLVFRLALDPARWDQVPAEDAVRCAMISGYRGHQLKKLEECSDFVAIHIRRGSDIHENHISGKEKVNRWVREEWHVALVKALRSIPHLASLSIRVYALGEESDFPLLAQAGVDFRLNGDRDSDLIEMSAARLLVLSPSSFSFTAALASRSVILGRSPWWHHIPNSGRWLTVDAAGRFDRERLESLLAREL